MNNTRGLGYGELEDNFQSPLPNGQNHLLGIGISKYVHWRALNNAAKDLDDITSILVEQYGFDKSKAVLLKDEEATRKNIVNTLYKYSEKTSQLKENDSLLIYFSGHGYLDKNNDGYWVPYESAPDDIDSFVANETIHRLIRHLNCRHILVISDSCFSGSLISHDRDIASDILTAQELEQKKSRWIITSGGRDQTVSDGLGSNSPFAEAILSELRHNQKPKLVVDELAIRVRNITRSNALQMPQFEKIFGVGDLGGRFIFNKKVPEKTETITATPTVDKEGKKVAVAEKNDALFYESGVRLIIEFMHILANNSFDVAVGKITPFVHHSLTQNGQLKADFKNNNLRVSYERIALYRFPIVIDSSKPTGRTFIGSLSNKEEGAEWLFSIAKKEEKGTLPAYIRIFFPKNKPSPSVVGISL